MIRFKLNSEGFDNAVEKGMDIDSVKARESICRRMTVSIRVPEMNESFREAIDIFDEVEDIEFSFRTLRTRVAFRIAVDGDTCISGAFKDDGNTYLNTYMQTQQPEVSCYLTNLARYVWNGIQYYLVKGLLHGEETEIVVKELNVHA